MRLICLPILILFALPAAARVVVDCEMKYPKGLEAPLKHVKLTEDEKGNLKLELDGDPHSAEAGTADLKNLNEYLKCDVHNEVCRDRAAAGHSTFKDLAELIGLGEKARKEREKPGLNKKEREELDLIASGFATSHLDIRKIAHGKSYVYGPQSNAGRAGIFEYYDKNDKLLGRYLYSLFIYECRDRNNNLPAKNPGLPEADPSTTSGTPQ